MRTANCGLSPQSPWGPALAAPTPVTRLFITVGNKTNRCPRHALLQVGCSHPLMGGGAGESQPP